MQKTRNKFPTGEKNPRWGGGKIKIKCEVCGGPFEIFPSRLNKQKYCSEECSIIGKSKRCSITKKGKRNPNYKGKYQDTHGYWMRHFSSLDPEELKLAEKMSFSRNCVLEHRLIIAKKIGRPLEENEIVHHRNEIKSDNGEENLQLLYKKTHCKGNLDHSLNDIIRCPKCNHEFHTNLSKE